MTKSISNKGAFFFEITANNEKQRKTTKNNEKQRKTLKMHCRNLQL